MKTRFTIPANPLILIILVLFSSAAHAQQFDWVTGGGTTDNSLAGNHLEAARFITTDPNGNIYALSTVGMGAITADTFYRASGAYGSDINFLVTSYTCTGQMRWAKLIASSGSECYPYDIKADSLGHVYVAGWFFNDILYIGYDTTIGVADAYDNTGLIQFDTSGHFNWVKFVGNNTPETGNSEKTIGSILAVDGANNVHYINNMKSGAPLMTGVTSQYGTYDLAYTPAGVLLSAKRVDLDSVLFITSATIDPATGKLFVCGQRDINLFGGNVSGFAAAFDTNRNVIWRDTLNNVGTVVLSSVIYDRMGHLYFNGFSNGEPFSFNGDSISEGASSIVLKTDTAANPIWLQAYYVYGSGVNYLGNNTLTLLPNNLVVSTGYFAGRLIDMQKRDSIVTYAGEGWNPFINVLDTSGVPMSLLQMQDDGFTNGSYSITSDRVGNVYVGGTVEDSIYAANGSINIPAYHSVGGSEDFFVMKYGMDCDCTSMPVANFSLTGTDTAHTKNFTYTGTTAGIDSVVWSIENTTVFGHGNAVVHIFDTGSYEVCVTVYTSCGNDMHCSRVTVIDSSLGVNNLQVDNIQVYPNPTANELTITNIPQGSKIAVSNIIGQQVFTSNNSNVKQTVDVSGLSNGSYLLQITKNDGSKFVQKFVIAR